MQGRDQSVIEHIFDYCKEINEELEQIGRDKDKFISSTVYKNSLALCVLQIGELVTLLSDDYKASKISVEWKSIKGMRKIVAHKYGTFDFDVLWETVTEDIPKLRAFFIHNSRNFCAYVIKWQWIFKNFWIMCCSFVALWVI